MVDNEHRHFIISRFDQYYDSINNKGNAFLAINTFLTGGLFASVAILPTYLEEDSSTIFWIVIMLVLNLTSTLFTLLALVPYAGTCGQSLVYFGDISRLDLQSFLQRFSVQQENEITQDLDKQIFYLAKGLDKKFRRLLIAGKLFFIEAPVLIPLIICVIKNLK